MESAAADARPRKGNIIHWVNTVSAFTDGRGIWLPETSLESSVLQHAASQSDALRMPAYVPVGHMREMVGVQLQLQDTSPDQSGKSSYAEGKWRGRPASTELACQLPHSATWCASVVDRHPGGRCGARLSGVRWISGADGDREVDWVALSAGRKSRAATAWCEGDSAARAMPGTSWLDGFAAPALVDETAAKSFRIWWYRRSLNHRVLLLFGAALTPVAMRLLRMACLVHCADYLLASVAISFALRYVSAQLSATNVT